MGDSSLKRDIELRTKAAQAYETGEPIMSDAKFDALNASIVQRGGDDPIGHGYEPTGDTVPHEVMMGTLVKAYTVEELFAVFGNDYENAVIEPKFDGSPLSVTYQDGKLVSAITRGDSWNGKDRTAAARNVDTIPNTISTKGRVIVRGEVIMPSSLLETINEDEEIENTYKSTRAAVPGILASNNGGTKYLVFYPYWASKKVSKKDYDLLFSDREFITTTENTVDGMNTLLLGLKAKYEGGEFPFDGAVLKHDVYSSLEDSVAYKFENERIQTTLNEVVWQTGRTGRRTPVAIFDPISFRGEKTDRANLHNIEYIGRLDLHLGDTIIVESAGGIIPQVSEVVKNNGGVRVLSLEWEEADETDIHARRLSYALSVLGVKHLGSRYAELAVQAFGLVSIMSFIGLSEDEIDAHIDRFTGSTVSGYLEPVSRAYDYSLLAALGLDKLGRSIMKNLMEHFDSIEALVDTLDSANAVELLEKVEGLGPNRIDTLIENVNLIAEIDNEFQELYGHPAASWKEENESVSAGADESNPIYGKTVVVTGTFPNLTRGEVEAYVRTLGGKNGKSVSSKTDMLVAGAKAGSKMTKAKTLGIDTMGAEEFESLVL